MQWTFAACLDSLRARHAPHVRLRSDCHSPRTAPAVARPAHSTPCPPPPRSRDPEAWKTVDILIDVGGEYDPSRHRYDHHQRGFFEVFGHGFSTKLSSAGLVYKHFGREIVASAPLPPLPPRRPLRAV